jgi:hypothetical protein
VTDDATDDMDGGGGGGVDMTDEMDETYGPRRSML